jgi:hypothetical protein
MNNLSMIGPWPSPFGTGTAGGEDIPRGWVVNDLRMSDDRAESASRISFTRPADDPLEDHTSLTRDLWQIDVLQSRRLVKITRNRCGRPEFAIFQLQRASPSTKLETGGWRYHWQFWRVGPCS